MAASAAEDIRGNMVDFFETIMRCDPDTEFMRGGGIIRHRHHIPFPMLNRVLQFSADAVRIEETAVEYRNANVPCLWLTWSDDPECEVKEALLEERGFQRIGRMPGMALELGEWDPLGAEPPSPLEILPAVHPSDVKALAGILQPAFNLPDAVRDALERFFLNAGLDTGAPIRHFVAWLDGRPVSTATMFEEGGVAGLYFVATSADYRGRGLGKAITLHALKEAKSRGAERVILHASQAGQGIYRNIGFQNKVQIGRYLSSITSG
ncbi:GNAT family N-acetyltransferase [Cohnella sp. CFH 77786]|uniref:GNAT family N-acetyltransferase n=1 Tax=Cohnella sp. CFH 77786 TaxID=2662265 RepID=UPI001C60CD9B|nr:GNAT family N-acetyltransferase [Cohnella sp. CFH 77786]MBW5446033.1 GNAT family N-acetyltransferase [Cohnella sp. CFH 77786]